MAAALVSSAAAGDRPTVQKVVFSPDNARVLVQSIWKADGSGFPHAALAVLNTGTGQTVKRVRGYTENTAETPGAVLNWLLTRNAPLLRDHSLSAGSATTPRYQRPATQAAPAWSEGLAAGQSRVYNVFLWSKEVPITLSVQKSQAPCPNAGSLPRGEGSAVFSLDVNGQKLVTPATPQTPCSARYALERVDLRGNRILVTVRAYSPGFEGPNATLVYAAGTLR